MMRFFDYIFYRIYMAFKNRGEEGVIGPSIFVGTCLALLSYPIWFLGYYLLIDRDIPRVHIYVIGSLFYIILYIRYKLMKSQITEKYSKSRYNKKISIFYIYFMLVVCYALGVSLACILDYKLESYHLEGILGKWLSIQ